MCRLGANVVPGTADDVQFFCNDGSCTAVEGRCNGVNNCEDGSDEALCPTDVEGVTLEPTSGHTATVETLTAGVQVFHDRGYTFKSLGSFSGMKFVKISNEDKNTPHSHVQLKLRIPQPLTVYVVTTQGQTLPWLYQQGWTEVHALTGVEYSGPRQTPDKDWHQANNLYLAGQTIAYGLDLIDEEQEHYGPGHVFEKTFPAGVVSMPGNGGGQGYDWTSGIEGGHGSYLTFLAHPSHQPVADINPTYSASNVGQYLGGHAAGDSTIRPISESQAACDAIETCGGITCRSDISCTVRTGPDLRTSPSGEFSYVRH